MTTNVFDAAAGIVATDARWSWQWGSYLIYLDDTGFEKIQVLDDLVIMFAGKGDQIQAWRDFLATTPRLLSDQPVETKDVSVCMVDAKTGAFVKFAGGGHHVFEGSRFAGTGGPYAYTCWMTNRDAKKAVMTAKAADRYSGGAVRFVDIKGRESNITPIAVQNPLTINHVKAAVEKRGLVMKISDNTILGTPVPFELAAANDGGLAQFAEQVANGQLPPSAPFEGMGNEWTADEKQGINDALALYGWK